MKKKTKKVLKMMGILLTIAVIAVVGVLLFANWKIPHDTKEYTFDNVSEVPAKKAALVLGTSKFIGNGNRVNPYFIYRIQAAKELYDAGKVKVLVVSGDNSRKDYNEPEDMRDELVKLGVPEKDIHLDYAGFRTLDSVIRMNEIFGQESFIIVSQQFHNERAIFLAQYYGLDTYGYNAKDVSRLRGAFKTNLREKFARVKVFVDIIVGKGPKFLGEPIEI